MAGNGKVFLLSEESLEWAKKHLQRFSDGDIFPKPFEFYAIWSNWEEVRTELLSLNLYDYQTGSTRIMAVPKSTIGFRISHQLDPIDSIIYFAFLFYLIPQLEKYRFSHEEGISCSYRFNLNVENGNLFDKEKMTSAWETFENKTQEHCESFSYILVTDLADFYNSIYAHRVQNSINDAFNYFDESTDDSKHIANVVEKFLMSLAASSSKGIPVGPTPSIALSEFILTDIDYFLFNNKVVFTRYADDIRIFVNSKKEAMKILQELTKYLYTHHRLSLSSSKTKILKSEAFLEENYSPEDDEKKKKSEWHELLGVTSDTYGLTDEQIAERIKEYAEVVNIIVLGEMLSYLIKQSRKEKFDLGLSRHLFSRLRIIKNKKLTKKVIKNLDKFLPTIKSVCLYLIEVIDEEFIIEHETLIKKQIVKLRSFSIPFVNLWLDYMILKNKYLRELEYKIDLFEKNNGISFKRKSFLVAMFNNNFSYIRQQKELAGTFDPWSFRSIVYASQILPIEERVWIDKLGNLSLLDKCVKKYIRRRNTQIEQEV